MKQLLITVFLFWSFSLVAQSDQYLHEYKSGKSILRYLYINRNDSSFMHGHLQEKKTNAPLADVNILIKDFAIGTVPDLDGNFSIFLPRQEGTIIFDKAGYTYFEFPYKYRKDELKKPSAHH